jgi:glycosyltransferase involved in cell wall biosynthesis
VGDGAARAEYEQLVEDLELADKVTFHGLKSKGEVAELMRQADLFVLPSLWENLPCVLIEAIATGLPIVSTLVGGIPEMVDEETGRLVPAGEVLKLSTAIAGMLESLHTFDRHVITQKARQYSPEVVGRLLDSIYRRGIPV